MEQITFSEQDVINAICFYIADKKQLKPEEVGVELMYDDDYGFSAEVFWGERSQILVTANMIEAIRLWLDTQMNVDPISAGISLVLDDEEGIVAKVQY